MSQIKEKKQRKRKKEKKTEKEEKNRMIGKMSDALMTHFEGHKGKMLGHKARILIMTFSSLLFYLVTFAFDL